jgi:hypothetical protein
MSPRGAPLAVLAPVPLPALVHLLACPPLPVPTCRCCCRLAVVVVYAADSCAMLLWLSPRVYWHHGRHSAGSGAAPGTCAILLSSNKAAEPPAVEWGCPMLLVQIAGMQVSVFATQVAGKEKWRGGGEVTTMTVMHQLSQFGRTDWETRVSRPNWDSCGPDSNPRSLPKSSSRCSRPYTVFLCLPGFIITLLKCSVDGNT